MLDTFVDTPEVEIAGIRIPTLVLSGVEDSDNGSPEALAALLPNGEYQGVPGGHMSAVIKPALGLAMADFLAR